MSDITIIAEPLPDVFLLSVPCYEDDRGDLTKLFHSDSLASLGIDFKPAEIFQTRSKAGVLRGMHFQVGRSEHSKLVTCTRGHVLDVVVDVRGTSDYFNKPFAIELSENSNKALLIGKGYAHGFLSLVDNSCMLYSTTTVHNPSLDRGVLWSSIDFNWPCINPLLSERDASHPRIDKPQ